jgi:O-antigen biosynthesis protein
MKLTVVIVNYNVKYFLEQCLISVQKACEGITAEVYVVDNNSVDGSVAMVAEKFPWALLIANTENTGFSKANNQAMRLAKGEYVLLLNPDTVVQEDTFRKVVQFMDEHPDAGGLGVRMVDGKGNFLPESKRGLPTPAVAFYKIFGLSALFPKSPRFGRYHLGNLSADETHEIEILSGAFMLMRKKTLDQVGLLDEAFFMYGEDIDLSWRIIQGGWKNYYYPDTRIIHYKGESTKKGSLNYVYVFYNAMVIFATKHFSERHAKWFSFFIQLAIWLRAGVAVLSRFVKAIFLPALDAIVSFSLFWLLRTWYSEYTSIPYDNRLVLAIFLPALALWLLGTFLGGGYDKPFKPLRAVRPLVISSLVILTAYSLLPEQMRFSRALMIGGIALTLFAFVLNRIMVNLLTTGKTGLRPKALGQIAIVGLEDEIKRVKTILDQVSNHTGAWIRVAPGRDTPNGFPGNLTQLEDIIRVHKVDQVIFCARDVASSDIISAMSVMSQRDVEFKIAPPESLYIIGSNSIETSGDIFMLDVNSISRPQNKRSKRALDLALCALVLIALPVLLIVASRRAGLFINWFRVLTGKKSWVGFCPQPEYSHGASLPRVKPGVLHPLSHISSDVRTSSQIQKLNSVYAKDYKLRNDLTIFWKNLRRLGD